MALTDKQAAILDDLRNGLDDWESSGAKTWKEAVEYYITTAWDELNQVGP